MLLPPPQLVLAKISKNILYDCSALCGNAVAPPPLPSWYSPKYPISYCQLASCSYGRIQCYNCTQPELRGGRIADTCLLFFKGSGFSTSASQFSQMSGVIFHFSKFLGTVHYNCFKICTFSYISSAILYNYSARKCCCWPLAAHRPAPKHVETIVCIWKQAQSLMTSATSVSNIYRYQALPLITDTNPNTCAPVIISGLYWIALPACLFALVS